MEHLIVNEIVLPKLKKLDDKIWQLSDETDAKIEGLKQGTYELADSLVAQVKEDTDKIGKSVDKLIKDTISNTDKAINDSDSKMRKVQSQFDQLSTTIKGDIQDTKNGLAPELNRIDAEIATVSKNYQSDIQEVAKSINITIDSVKADVDILKNKPDDAEMDIKEVIEKLNEKKGSINADVIRGLIPAIEEIARVKGKNYGGGGGGTGTGGATTGAYIPYAEIPTGTIDGTNKVFTLVNAPASSASVQVILDGVQHYNGIDYTVSGSTITFVTAPIVGTTIFSYYYNLVSGTPTITFYAETPTGLINSTNAVYNLIASPSNVNSLLLILDGVTQYAGVDYTLVGSTTTFVTAPLTGSTLFAYYSNNSVITGGTGTVTSVTSTSSDMTVATGTTTPALTIVSAPKLTTARTINGVAFDGTSNITISSTDATKQPLDAGLTSISALTGAGYMKATATDTFTQVTTIPESDITGLVTDLASKQGLLTVTTTGTSGASTLIGNTLNIPQYAGGGVTPTGTGFNHITAGVQDVASKLVDTADINSNQVTNAKLSQMATNTIKGNNTGATANALDLTTTQVKSMLAIASTDVSGLAPIATSGSAADLSTGTILAARMPAHTGDATSSVGAVDKSAALPLVAIGARPDTSVLAIASIDFTCVVVKSKAFAVTPVLLPLMVLVAICDNFALVTWLLLISAVSTSFEAASCTPAVI